MLYKIAHARVELFDVVNMQSTDHIKEAQHHPHPAHEATNLCLDSALAPSCCCCCSILVRKIRP
jgi:hypothetical protein